MPQERTQEQEMSFAYGKKKQPNCVHCGRPLDEVRQEQNEDIVWKWDKQLKQYKKTTDGTAEKPYHPACDSADWGYIDEELVSF
jgi:ribosomal protein L34E